MRSLTRVGLAVLVAGFAGAALAQGQSDKAPGRLENNWGELTSREIAEGFEQGPHSRDPSGDGHGPGTADEPRAGLPNIVEQGNMAATTQLIDSLLSEPD